MSASNRRKVLLVSLAILLVGVLWLRTTEAGDVATVRGFLRAEYIWGKYFPADWGKGLVGKLEPMMTELGIVHPVRLQVRPGITMQLDPGDLVSRTILVSLRTRWDPDVWQSMSSNLGEGAVMLDVGAHIGYFSLMAASVVGPTGKVVAFEPNPRTFRVLKANVEASAADNVALYEIACADSEGELMLYDTTASGNSGASSLSQKNAGEQARAYKVRARPIDAVVNELGLQRVDVIKLDVEGAELTVLKGAEETIRRFHPKLVLEVVPGNLAGMGTTVDQLFSYLRRMGYNSGRKIDAMNWAWIVQDGPGRKK